MNLSRLLLSLLAVLLVFGAPRGVNAQTPQPVQTPQSPQAPQGRRIALVIGNGAYPDGLGLSNPPRDAQGMTAALRELGFTVTQLLDARGTVIRETVSRIVQQTQQGDTVLVFYSGHGMSIRGANYLIGVDPPTDREGIFLRDTVVPVEEILTQIRQRNVTALLFFDACRVIQREFYPSFRRNGGITGFADLRSPPNSLLAFSTQATNIASDGEAGTNSPFTSALLQYIRRPGADIGVVLRLVSIEVLNATAGRQVPWVHSSLIAPVILAPAGNVLPRQSCSLTGTLRSTARGAQASLRLVNRTQTPFSFAWVDAAGRTRPASQLNPGMERTQPSQTGHVWMVQDQQGRCQGLYLMTPEDAVITLDD